MKVAHMNCFKIAKLLWKRPSLDVLWCINVNGDMKTELVFQIKETITILESYSIMEI